MPLQHNTPISMKALNYNIDQDLIFNTAYSQIRRESDVGSLTLIGGSAQSNGGWIRLWGNTGGGLLHTKVDIGMGDSPHGTEGVMLSLIEIPAVPTPLRSFQLSCKLYSDGIALLKNFPNPTDGGDLTNKTYVDGIGAAAEAAANAYADGVGAAAEAAANTYTDSKFPAWQAWSPTYVFTGGTPTGDGSVCRYTRYGNTVHFEAYIYFADSNGAKLASFTLPISLNASAPYLVPINGFEQYGGGLATSAIIQGYMQNTDVTKGKMLISYAGTSGQPFRFSLAATYEV